MQEGQKEALSSQAQMKYYISVHSTISIPASFYTIAMRNTMTVLEQRWEVDTLGNSIVIAFRWRVYFQVSFPFVSCSGFL